MTDHLDHLLGYTADELNSAPADSYMGHERDLADMLTDDTLEAIDAALDADELAAYTLFMILMMNPVAARAMTIVDEAEQDLAELIQCCQDDARDDSSEVFQARVAQRLELRKTLRGYFTTPPSSRD